MNAREPTWFVRLQGHTLGPLSTDELRKSVRAGEISPEDKLNRAGELTWRRLAEHPDLYADWESIRRPTFAANLPSPQLLWKKSRAPTPAKVEAAPAPAAPLAAIPAAPEEIPAAAAKSKRAAKKAAPKKKAAKKTKAAPAAEPTQKPSEPSPAPAFRLSAGSKPSPLATEPAAENPLAVTPPVGDSEPVAQPKTTAAAPIVRLLDPTVLKLHSETLFPTRPEVPNVEPIARPAYRPEERRLAKVPRNEDRRQKILRIAAVVTLVLAVAGVAYYAGQKTRDLKELPLPDPSSPTTQLPAAGDPILPLRAPTRPQRD